jgi:molybdopterin synthase catalytic subunit
MSMEIRVQTDDFDLGAEVAALRHANPAIGAVVSFVGTVRDMNVGSEVSTLELEHYPGMTEKALKTIVEQARSRWTLANVLVIHRVGKLYPTDQIVLVAVTSAHRDEAFDACRFVMDYLKSEAPFWKKENTPSGERWVEARASDETSMRKWQRD